MVVERPSPEPGPGELLIEVVASAVTQADRRLRAADFPAFAVLPGRLALGLVGPRAGTPGTCFAGRVVAVGSAASGSAASGARASGSAAAGSGVAARDTAGLRVGDDVFGLVMHGAYAERLVVRADGAVARMPAGCDHASAAALAYGATGARYFVAQLGEAAAGDRVVVLGAAGGLGRYAVQVAAALGCEVVGVCRPERRDAVLALGASRVVGPNEALSEPGGWDVVFDTTGAVRLWPWWRRLAPSGRLVTADVSVTRLLVMGVTAVGGGRRLRTGLAPDSRAGLEEVASLVERGALRPVVGASFSLERIADAHRCLEAGGLEGDVVVATGA